MSILDINTIKEYLPHRYPFLLVDRVLEYNAGKSIIALKNLTVNEPFFNGHFPLRPVMPGVLQLEALAQTAGILYFLITDTKPDPQNNWFYFAGINDARFKRVVVPGDQLKLHVEVGKHKRDIWVFNAKATVDDELASCAELMIVRGGLK